MFHLILKGKPNSRLKSKKQAQTVARNDNNHKHRKYFRTQQRQTEKRKKDIGNKLMRNIEVDCKSFHNFKKVKLWAIVSP